MNTLHSKILRGLGIPVILFVIILLVVNFFYVDRQLKELTYSYVDNIAREADNRLIVQVKEIEELARVLAVYLRQDRYINEMDIQKLLNRLLDADERYDIFIVRNSLVIEGRIQGDDQSDLRQRVFNSADETGYQYYYGLAGEQNTWASLRFEAGDWKTSYIVAFETAANQAPGIIVVDVPLYELVKNLLSMDMSANAKILFAVRQDDGEIKTLLLDPERPQKIELLTFNLLGKMDMQHSFDAVYAPFKFSADTVQIDDPLDGEGQIFIAQLPSGFSPNVQLIALLPKEEIFAYIYNAKFIESISVLIAFGGLVALILLISRSISRPISAFTTRVEDLAAGNLDARFPKTDVCVELNSLSENLNRTVKQLKSYFSDLKRVTAQNEKVNSEINISHNVQMSLLPSCKKAAEISGVDVHAYTLPAKEVGGDFYYFFKIDQDRTALVIGDVSGKGMPAAMMMAVCLSLFKAQSANTLQPDVCLQKINQFLMREDTSQCVFVTLFYALVNASSGELIYANAGHNPPLMLRKTGAVEFLDQQHGAALAVTENVCYKTHREKLNYGDMLLLYTDGITEAHNMAEEEFGEQRLIESAIFHNEISNTQSAKHCVQSIVKRVAQFIRGCVQFDDMTLLCAVRRGETKTIPAQQVALRTLSAYPISDSIGDTTVAIAELHKLQSQYRIGIRRDIKEINKVIALVDAFCQDYQVNNEIAADLCVVVDEFVSNVIRHGKVSEDANVIQAQLVKREDIVLVVLEYRGKDFNPLSSSAPMHENWRQRRLGGLGIHIGQQLTNGISYAHSDGQNVLVIEKKLQAEKEA